MAEIGDCDTCYQSSLDGGSDASSSDGADRQLTPAGVVAPNAASTRTT